MPNVFNRARIAALVLLAAACAGCVNATSTPTATLAPTSTEQAQPTEAPFETPTSSAPDSTPAATEAPQPTATMPSTTVPAAPGDSQGQIEAMEAAVPELQDARALAEAFRDTGPLPEVARTTPLDVKVGDVETFWVSDQEANDNYQIKAELRYTGPVVLMYVDTSVEYDQAALEKSAREFEQRIYPRNRMLFGEEQAPGIDGDKRLTVLNTLVRGAGGYFSPNDGIVRGANRFSNERDMFVIDIGGYPFGSVEYASTLAHEFQHMIHDSQQPQSATWFNEGMSTLAEDLNGYNSQYTALLYLSDPDINMIDWVSDTNHYGMAQLFLRYFYEQYAGADVLQELIRNNSGYNLEEFATLAARKRSDVATFEDIFADWATANLINDPGVGDGRYTYSLLPRTIGLEEAQTGSFDTTVHQYGVDYIALPAGATLDFDGATTVSLAGVPPAEGAQAWWSGRFDQSTSTLTRQVDLSGVSQATLQFKTWYEIERNWDYAFVTVSADNGTTWKTLEATTSTSDDPQGANFGNGITGISGGSDSDLGDGVEGRWIDETVDLSAYAGQQVLLRFWMITDTAVDGTNILLDDIRIPEINFADGAENGDAGWEAKGFVRVSGTLPQRWELRLVRGHAGQTSVEPLELDTQGHAELALNDGERGVLVVTAVTPFTSRLADYHYSIAP